MSTALTVPDTVRAFVISGTAAGRFDVFCCCVPRGPCAKAAVAAMSRTAKVDKRVFFIEVVSLFDLRRSKCTVPAKVSKRVKSTPWAAGGGLRVRNTRAGGRHRAQALRGRGGCLLYT